jgi:hypothetical protein
LCSLGNRLRASLIALCPLHYLFPHSTHSYLSRRSFFHSCSRPSSFILVVLIFRPRRAISFVLITLVLATESFVIHVLVTESFVLVVHVLATESFVLVLALFTISSVLASSLASSLGPRHVVCTCPPARHDICFRHSSSSSSSSPRCLRVRQFACVDGFSSAAPTDPTYDSSFASSVVVPPSNSVSDSSVPLPSRNCPTASPSALPSFCRIRFFVRLKQLVIQHSVIHNNDLRNWTRIRHTRPSALTSFCVMFTIELDHIPLFESAQNFSGWKRFIAHVEGAEAYDIFPKSSEPAACTTASKAEEKTAFKERWEEDIEGMGNCPSSHSQHLGWRGSTFHLGQRHFDEGDSPRLSTRPSRLRRPPFCWSLCDCKRLLQVQKGPVLLSEVEQPFGHSPMVNQWFVFEVEFLKPPGTLLPSSRRRCSVSHLFADTFLSTGILFHEVEGL